jgi:hypothetical protein
LEQNGNGLDKEQVRMGMVETWAVIVKMGGAFEWMFIIYECKDRASSL